MAAIEVVTIERFKCPTCGATYGERHLAELCAARPVSQDRGVKVGDTVLYGKYAGTELKYEGKDYLIMKEDDIFAIL